MPCISYNRSVHQVDLVHDRAVSQKNLSNKYILCTSKYNK